MEVQVGDIVARRSYGCDVYFRVEDVNQSRTTAILIGEDVRLIADAPMDDLVMVNRLKKDHS